jgi:lactate dehydrogenase-like 2-hydroxyacid dehydrogenase
MALISKPAHLLRANRILKACAWHGVAVCNVGGSYADNPAPGQIFALILAICRKLRPATSRALRESPASRPGTSRHSSPARRSTSWDQNRARRGPPAEKANKSGG